MRTRLFAAALLSSGLFLASCEAGSSAGDDKAVSNSIDSVKQNGAAPVQYGPDNPVDDTITSTGTGEQVIQTNDGLMERQNPGGAATGARGTNGANNPPASPNTSSNPRMQGNTSDARTSGGSANGKDADGRR